MMPNIQNMEVLNPKTLALGLVFSVLLALSFLTLKFTYLSHPSPDGFRMANNEKLLGGDFIAFYVGGKLFSDSPSELYNFQYQKTVREDVLSRGTTTLEGDLPYVYPPLVAGLFSLVSDLPFESAFYVWSLTSFFVSFACLYLLFFSSIPRGPTSLIFFAVLVCGYLPYSMNTIVGGQLSSIGIVLCTLVALALRHKHEFMAGLALSLSYYKPPLFLLLLLTLVCMRSKRFLYGFAFGGLVLLTLTVSATNGPYSLIEFIEVGSRYTYGQNLIEGKSLPTNQGAGVFALLVELFGIPLASTVMVGLTLMYAYTLFRYRQHYHESTIELLLAFCILFSVGMSIQCIRYDLAILLVSFFLLLQHFDHYSTFFKFAVITTMSSFYFEFLGRYLQLGNASINISSVSFLLSYALFGWAILTRRIFSPEKELSQRPTFPSNT